MSVILWKIIIVSIILVETMIGAYLGWRVLGLMKRVKQVQEDRNDLLESRGEWEALWKEKILLSKPERQMIIAALDMPEYSDEIKDPKTSFQMRKIYRDLREKIKESIKDD